MCCAILSPPGPRWLALREAPDPEGAWAGQPDTPLLAGTRSPVRAMRSGGDGTRPHGAAVDGRLGAPGECPGTMRALPPGEDERRARGARRAVNADEREAAVRAADEAYVDVMKMATATFDAAKSQADEQLM